MAPWTPGSRSFCLLCCCCCCALATLLAHAGLAVGAEEGASSAWSPRPVLPVSYRLSRTRLAFFLRESRPGPAANGSGHGGGHGGGDGPLQRAEPFVVFQTKELPVLNASLGPLTTSRVLPRELLQPPSPLDVPGQLTVNWKVRAFIVRLRVPATQPVAQVLFYVAGRDWDDFRGTERLPCVRLHAFRQARDVHAACRLGGGLASCLAQAPLPAAWFGPARRRRRPPGAGPGAPEGAGPGAQAELYYSLHAPGREGAGEGEGECAGAAPGAPLRRVGSVRLVPPPAAPAQEEQRLDANVFIRRPGGALRPGDVLTVLLCLHPNASVHAFTLRVKAKKGVTLLLTKSRSPQWLVNSELLPGGKHSTATVDVSRVGDPTVGAGPAAHEVLQLDFEMENFTSQSVKRRILWHVEYRARGPPPPDPDKVVTELTVVQRDIHAILPLAMDTEIINTAILTGRTVAIPVKVIAVEATGAVVDVSALVECQSDNEDIIKVSSSCDYVFVSGKESRGSMNARVTFRYDTWTAPLEMTVWVPKLPLLIQLSDAHLSQVRGWRVPVLPDRRSVRESEDAAAEEDEEEEGGGAERRPNRGCTLQYQHTTLQVFTQFHTTSPDGPEGAEGPGAPAGPAVTMLGPDWLVEVTDLVGDFMKVDDPRVAQMVDGSTLAGREPGVTLFKVVSPLMEAVLGQTPVTVSDEKVSVTELKAQVVSSLSLSLQPSPRGSHTILARTDAQQTLSFVKQEALLSLWLSFSDGSTAPLSLYSPKDYALLVSSLDERVATVAQARAFPLVVAQAEGAGDLLRAELTIGESCQKTRRKSVLATARAAVRVRFGPDEDEAEEESPGPGAEASTVRPAPATMAPAPEDAPTVAPGSAPAGRGLTDLEIGMYALLGVFCLAILVFLINCIVFVLKYRHKRVPVEGQTGTDHSHHWVFLGNGQPLRARGDLSPQPGGPGDPLEASPARRHPDGAGGGGSSPASVQSQAHGRGDGSSGGSAREQAEDPVHSPTSKRKRVKFTTFATLPSEEPAYNSVPVGDEEDPEWGPPGVPREDGHGYGSRVRDVA
ncbi:transmembrane protein 132E [Tachyglossus aculeatus]|uniref:transmembrane protein 132E n=1 Tax=Tachyglossus aculeatus TaxID=9261 RepID=UPI0018F354FC|nr:transmembrane protein 132E [Tachyglossus aculeatus]